MDDRLEALELLRRSGRIGKQDTRSRDWTNLTMLPHERMAFVYPRLSTHEQRERSVWSVERQRWLEELARLDGYQALLSKEEIEEIRSSPGYAGWYQNGRIVVDERDLGISGTLGRKSRRALDHLIELIEAGQVESIYAVEVSRLWRDKSLTGDRSLSVRSGAEHSVDVDDALRFGRLCKERNVLLVMPHMRLNLNDRMHWRIYRTEAERAAEELEMMQYRLGGARTLKARQGFHPGGPSIPVGYILDTDKSSRTYQKLIPYDSHAQVVRAVFERYVASEGSCYRVVRWCCSNGVRLSPFPPELAEVMKGRWAYFRSEPEPDGWPVTVHLVRSMITNPKYIGWWVYQGEVISQNNHTPIVDEAKFWEAVALANSEQAQRRGRAASFPPSLLSGLVYCCNHEGESRLLRSSGVRDRHWYSCNHDYINGRSDRQCLSVTDYILEKPITEFVTSQCSYLEHAEAVLRQLEEEGEQEREAAVIHQRRHRELRQAMETLKVNCSNLLQSEHYTPERHAELEAMIREKEDQLRSLNTAKPTERRALTNEQMERVRQFLGNIRLDWQLLSAELRREFLTRIALERVLIRHDKENIWCRIIWRTGRTNEIVIHRPFVDERTPWTDEEESTLRETFYESSKESILALLSKRSWTGITRHAQTLGLTRKREPTGGAGVPKRRWEDWEMDLLRRYYDAKISKDELQAALPHRPWDFIKAKANQMGLRWTERQPWEPRLRWEVVPEGTFFCSPNITTVLSDKGQCRPCRSGR